MFYWIKTPSWIKRFFSSYSWQIPQPEPCVYLTFDDGPIPEVTPWVLEQLKQYNAKATFFCIGDNVDKHPEILQRILAEGHRVGNHTYHHLNAWKTNTDDYLANVARCEEALKKYDDNPKPRLMRPPYGKITPRLTKKLKKEGYQIVLWDILTADFDTQISPEQCAKNAVTRIENGSILIFHDSKKAYPNLEYALPYTLRELHQRGYTFKAL